MFEYIQYCINSLVRWYYRNDIAEFDREYEEIIGGDYYPDEKTIEKELEYMIKKFDGKKISTDFSNYQEIEENSKKSHYNSGPPIELYKQYFSIYANYNPKGRLPDELIALDIEIISLADSKECYTEASVKYVAKFLSNFCKNSVSYNALSKYGKEKIDSIYTCEETSIQKAIKASGCLYIHSEGDDL